MQSEQRTTILSNSRAYFTNELISNSLYLISISILTRWLDSSQWGYYSTTVIFFRVITQLSSTTFSQGLFRLYFKKEADEQKRMIGSVLLMSLLTASAFSCITVLFGNSILGTLFSNIGTTSKTTLFIISFWIFLLNSRTIATTLSKAKEKPFTILKINSSFHGTHLVLVITAFLLDIPPSIEIAFSFLLFSEILSAFFCFRSLRVPLRFNVKYINECLQIALPLTGSTFLFTAFLQTDKVIISNFIDLNTMGSYNLGIMIGGLVGTVATTLLSPINARLLNILKTQKNSDAEEVSKQANKDILILLTISACIAISFANIGLPIIGGEALLLGIATMALIGRVIGQIFRTIQQLFQNGLYYSEKYRLILIINLSLPILGTTSAYLLVKYAGTNAISFYFPFSYAILSITTYYITKFFYNMTIPKTTSIICFAYLGITSTLESLPDQNRFTSPLALDLIQFVISISLVILFRETLTRFIGIKTTPQASLKT